MLRISLCLLLTVAFVSVAFAQQRHTDIQSLQYEFGKVVSTGPVQTPTQVAPCPCAKPVVYAPVARGCCYPSCYKSCSPCYTPVPRCYVASKVYRRACVRPVYAAPYYW